MSGSTSQRYSKVKEYKKSEMELRKELKLLTKINKVCIYNV